MPDGPAYAPSPQGPRVGWNDLLALIAFGLFMWLVPFGTVWMWLFFAACAAIAFARVLIPARRRQTTRAGEPVPSTAAELRERARRHGAGAYLATGQDGHWYSAPPQSAVLILAGPRAGKTSCVVIPALMAHPGAAVATSTKPEVLRSTLPARRGLGQRGSSISRATAHPPAAVRFAGRRSRVPLIGSRRS